jgi:hypothetical protein
MDYASTKEIIHQTNILSKDDAEFIDRNISAIQANWEKKQMWRTETEMRISVLNDVKFPTVASKYWQCVREQSVFYEQLVIESFAYRRHRIKIAKLERKLNKALDDSSYDTLDLELLQIKMEEALYGKMNMELAAKDRMREIRLWAKLMDESIEADPAFDTENVDTHQFISYVYRWHEQLKGMDQSNSSVSEVNNLVGQYSTALRIAYDRGIVLPKVLQDDAKQIGIPWNTKAISGPGSMVTNINSVTFDTVAAP